MAACVVAAVQGWTQSGFDGCISADTEVRRRPYHRNCGCALHQARFLPEDVPCGTNRVSYQARRSWGGIRVDSTSVSSRVVVVVSQGSGDMDE